MSPDGNWVWDGSQWQPVTGVEPTHEGVFAAYAHKVEVADQTAAVAQPAVAVAPVPAAAPAADYSYPAPAVDYGYPAAEPGVPLWQQQKSSGKSVYLYAGGAVVLFVIVLIVLNSINFVSLPFIGRGTSSSPPQAATPSPSASPYSRSEFGRGDAFLNGALYSSLVTLAKFDPPMATCNGEFTNGCFDAITVTEPPMKNVLSVALGSIPACIEGPMKQFRDDLAYMEGGLQASLKAYKDGNHSELVDGLSRWVVFYNRVGPDFQATNAILKARCSTEKEGP
jgi:hypothetical protein